MIAYNNYYTFMSIILSAPHWVRLWSCLIEVTSEHNS